MKLSKFIIALIIVSCYISSDIYAKGPENSGNYPKPDMTGWRAACVRPTKAIDMEVNNVRARLKTVFLVFFKLKLIPRAFQQIKKRHKTYDLMPFFILFYIKYQLNAIFFIANSSIGFGRGPISRSTSDYNKTSFSKSVFANKLSSSLFSVKSV